MRIADMPVQEVVVHLERALVLDLKPTPSRLKQLRNEALRVQATPDQHKLMQKLLDTIA